MNILFGFLLVGVSVVTGMEDDHTTSTIPNVHYSQSLQNRSLVELTPIFKLDFKIKAIECGEGIVSSPSCSCGLKDVPVMIPSQLVKNSFRFVMVKRCAGTCPNSHRKCEATSRNAMEISVQSLNPNKAEESTWVTHHDGCNCICHLTHQNCIEPKHLNKETCRCECQKAHTCIPGIDFNTDTCSCECEHNSRNCSTGYKIDPIDCECKPIPTKPTLLIRINSSKWNLIPSDQVQT